MCDLDYIWEIVSSQKAQNLILIFITILLGLIAYYQGEAQIPKPEIYSISYDEEGNISVLFFNSGNKPALLLNASIGVIPYSGGDVEKYDIYTYKEEGGNPIFLIPEEKIVLSTRKKIEDLLEIGALVKVFWCIEENNLCDNSDAINMWKFPNLPHGSAEASFSIRPDSSPSGNRVDFKVEIGNSGLYPIREIRIIKNSNYTDLSCKPLSGWELIFVPVWFDSSLGNTTTQMCWYFVKDGYGILRNDVETFDISVVAPAFGCDFPWKIEVMDVPIGMWTSLFYYTSIEETC